MNTIYISKNHCSQTKNPSNSFRLLLTGAALALFAGASVSCGTMQGVGQDVEDAGEGVQRAAR